MLQGRTKLRINDQVEVIAGKDKDRVGKILTINKEAGRATVERINMITKHMKSTDPSQPGQLLEREAAIHISNLMLICPECAKTVRIGNKILEDGSKVRICKNCSATIETNKK